MKPTTQLPGGHCAVVLPGGGARAAYQASHAHEFPQGVARLEHFWATMHCDRIYRTDSWTVMVSGLHWIVTMMSGGLLKVQPRSLLDNEPLRNFLQATLRLGGIEKAIAAKALRGVAVTASGYSRATAVSFFQGENRIQAWRRTRRLGQPAEINISHLLASAALPLMFPAERIENEYYGDGGMRMVAPLSPAIHLGADRILIIGTRDEEPDPEPEYPAMYPSVGEIGGYLLDTIFMDTLNADIARLQRINHTLSLVPDEQRKESRLKQIESLVIRPSRDLRLVTQEHVQAIPRSVRILLRTLGGWGRDWRMASYLLFAASYCQQLIQLGYADGMRKEKEIRHFLCCDGAPSRSETGHISLEKN
jgi:NTE family protein